MLQRYHLILRSRNEPYLLADIRPVGWMLPVVTADARSRATSAIARFLDQFHLRGTLVCVTAGTVDTEAAGIDWLSVVDVIDVVNECPIRLVEEVQERILEQRPLVPVQSSLIRTYQRMSDTLPTRFSRDRLADAIRWVAHCVPDLDATGSVQAIPHRVDLFRSTWEFRSPSAAVFLKWCGNGAFLEPALAEALVAAGGAHVPRTLAYERATGRWLTEGIAGKPLTSDLSARTVSAAVAALARVQMNLLSAEHRLRSIGVHGESIADLAAEGDGLLDQLPGSAERPDVRAARSRIHEACRTLDRLQLRNTWIHTDLVPENIFLGSGGVYFIDFEDPWIGPAPIALEFLFSGVRRHVSDEAARSVLVAAGQAAFSNAWKPCCSPRIMNEAFGSTRLAAEVLRVSRRLRAAVQKERNGELVGFTSLAAQESGERLVALANRSPTAP